MKCYICGCKDGLKLYEPIKGIGEESWVMLCEFCERMCNTYPDYGEVMRRETQARTMLLYGMEYDEWEKRFGRSFL